MLQRLTQWPPDYEAVYRFRHDELNYFADNPRMIAGAKEYYRTHPTEFIEHWCDTVDPRNANVEGKHVRMPFVLFLRQREFVQFIYELLEAQASGLVEKSRDMGATWLGASISTHLFLFWEGAAIGWGSRKATLVDKLGDMSCIFEKIRAQLRGLPPIFWPAGFSEDNMNVMKITNPETGSSIVGEGGDDVGRGGRTLVYFFDEAAHHEHPESVEAALSDNTRVRVDISSVNGLGNVFHRKRESGIDWEPGQRMSRDHVNVFVMDWRDHPDKTQQWYDERRVKAESEGLLHLFAQEVDRDYASSVEGVIVPAEWVVSAIDAHKKIKRLDEGRWVAALDVADGGGDRNALAQRKGVVLRLVDEWGARDTGQTARKSIDLCRAVAPVSINYDCIGVGSGVKAEVNRLREERLLPRGISFTPWDAGAAPINPDENVVPGDSNTPLNKDHYGNLKAQGWWELRRRFERTHFAITKGHVYSPDLLISIDSTLPRLRQLQKELSQPVQKPPSGRMKLIVDKLGEGMRSPNLADAVMMCFHPMSTYDPFMGVD